MTRKKPERRLLHPPTSEGFIEIAKRSKTIKELQMLWKNARDMGLLTSEVQDVMRQQVAYLKARRDWNRREAHSHDNH